MENNQNPVFNTMPNMGNTPPQGPGIGTPQTNNPTGQQNQPPMAPPPARKKHVPILELILIGLPIVAFLFVMLFFGPGACKDAGHSCRTIQIVTETICVLMSLTSVLILLFRNWQARLALCIQLMLQAAMTLFFPITKIGFCTDETMACLRLMRPCILVIGIVMIVAGIVELIAVLVTSDRHRR